jgi:hypothetical protein
MKTIAGVLIAAALAFGSGCVRSDWIERTLVTVDVTGTWQGTFPGSGYPDVLFELEQQGSTGKGFIRFSGRSSFASGSIDGTVAGDVFCFKDKRGSMEGELAVSGDEMKGRASIGGAVGGRGEQGLSLRRAESSSRPDSPRR